MKLEQTVQPVFSLKMTADEVSDLLDVLNKASVHKISRVARRATAFYHALYEGGGQLRPGEERNGGASEA